jgi:HTH-type transcriptional regulator / antitoxin HigA
MTLTFDRSVYCNLLTEIAPKIIETEDEYESALSLTERLTFQKNRTLEETALYKLLVTLIETYLSLTKFSSTLWNRVLHAKLTW